MKKSGLQIIVFLFCAKTFAQITNPEYSVGSKKKEMAADEQKGPVRLSENVNSIYPEMGPLVSPDGKTLYFSRVGDPADVGGENDKEDIWYSEWDENKKEWSKAKNIGPPLNNDYPNFINSVSPDGNTLLLGNGYAQDDDADNRQGVSISHRVAGSWSVPQKLVIENDVNHSRWTNYFLSSSKKVLLMSHEIKKETYGDLDLYVSFLKPDGTWSRPLNLGNKVNTKGTEATPFLASDDRSLYYASNGLKGYGGSDIYVARRLDSTWQNWSEPQNLGPEINTSNDESFFSITASGKDAYYTSEGRGGKGDIDIYRISLAPTLKPLPVVLVKGRVLNSKTKEPVPGAKIIYENLANGAETGVAVSDPVNGTYQVVLPAGTNYGYLASKEKFISVHENLDLGKLESYGEIDRDLYITPIETGQIVTFNNIFFDFNKHELKSESFPELNRLAKLLGENKTMKVEIDGYTDNVGSRTYNSELSDKRAEAVLQYLLLKSGIEKSRLQFKGFGELNPKASNETEDGRKLNRRVEFKIIAP